MTDKIRLNIGAGDTQIPGFISLDIKTGTDVTERLPYADDSVDEIYMSHTLEHIHHSKVPRVLTDIVRVLKPGGRIRIAVPRFENILERIRDGSMSMGLANAWMFGSHDVPTDRHQFMPTWEGMELMLMSLRIEGIGEWQPEYNDCSRLPDSMNIGGRKRQTIVRENPKVVMILSTGRFGPIDLYAGVSEFCRVKGWKLFQWGGDNWAKALTQLIAGTIATEDPDYILTLDFDSCFDAQECAKLVDFMQDHPEIGAAWPVQAHRHTDNPLGLAPQFCAAGYYDFSKTNPWKGEFTPYGSGHFGCTVIRRQVFDSMPRPWFKGLPSVKTDQTTQEITDVDWNNDALDNDISFWIAMQARGFVFGQLNTVQIGHMEWCVKWIEGDKVLWQPIQNWRKHGRPKNAIFDGEAWQRKMRKKFGVPEPEAALSTIEAPKNTVPIGSPELSMPSTNDPDAYVGLIEAAKVDGYVKLDRPMIPMSDAEAAFNRDFRRGLTDEDAQWASQKIVEDAASDPVSASLVSHLNGKR